MTAASRGPRPVGLAVDGDAIGGYLPLETGRSEAEPYPGALRFQSARAALAALLAATRPRRLWLPALLCDSVPSAAAHAGIPVSRYFLDKECGTPAGVRLARGEALLFVNYFGVMASAERAVLDAFPADQVILDHAQAFFAPPRGMATLYSPRKVFGIPDGGLLVTRRRVAVPTEEDTGSVGRCAHLLKRLAGPAEHGYADFQAAEASLDGCRPLRMSRLTRRLLASVDADAVRRARDANFRALHARLRADNGWPFPVGQPRGPLCYPFLRDRPRDDARMRRHRVYVPTYWPEARARCPPRTFERSLLDRLLPLPIDQRYRVDGAYLRRLTDAGIT